MKPIGQETLTEGTSDLSHIRQGFLILVQSREATGPTLDAKMGPVLMSRSLDNLANRQVSLTHGIEEHDTGTSG